MYASQQTQCLFSRSSFAKSKTFKSSQTLFFDIMNIYTGRSNQRTIGPVNARLISWPSKAQNIQILENIW